LRLEEEKEASNADVKRIQMVKWLLRKSVENAPKYTLHVDHCPYCGGDVSHSTIQRSFL